MGNCLGGSSSSCPYDDKDWDELPANVQEAAGTLGYTKKMWDKDKEPDVCDKDWAELTKEQQDAAGVLGYDQAKWDAE